MLKIPEPLKETTLKVSITEATKRELENFVKYVQSTQSHATMDKIVEACINKVIPMTGRSAKAYKEFKQNIAKKLLPGA